MKLKEIKRDEHGLITGGAVKYIFNEEGFVDWRKMIKPEFLVPNLQKTSEKDVTKLKDSELIILIGGIKDLAHIRGYTDVRYNVTTPSKDYVAVSCSIKFTPNYETEGKEVVFGGVGDAGPHNTHGFGQAFLGPIAENRAFVRAVRNFLRINIVGMDEMAERQKFVKPFSPQAPDSFPEAEENQASPVALLEQVMKEKKVNFGKVKKRLEDEGYDKVDSISNIHDIPKAKIFELIERLKKIKS
jgi:hypothetical protein